MQDIFLVHRDVNLMSHFQKEFGKNGTALTSVKSVKVLTQNGRSRSPIVVIDSEGDWVPAVKKLQAMKKGRKEFYAIISSTSMLKKTVAQIHETVLSLNAKKDGDKAHQEIVLPKDEENQGYELHLTELVERKLNDFVQKIKHCKVTNLYALLIREFEKPIIALALRETQGNQVQAAELLGMNRNTLRKKMNELKISPLKDKKSNPQCKRPILHILK